MAAGFYYYFKVIAAMYWRDPEDATPIKVAPLTRIAITALGTLIIVFGIFPAPILMQLQPQKSAAAAHVAQH